MKDDPGRESVPFFYPNMALGWWQKKEKTGLAF
jgi:hypothetical protein